MSLSLTEFQVAELLEWDALIEEMARAMIAFSAGEETQLTRVLHEVKPHGGYFGPKLAVSKDAMGIKLFNFYRGNAGTGIPAHLALIFLFKPDTGEPMAIIEGELITKIRTAAVSAVATCPSPLRCSPFSATERRQVRMSKRSDMSATSRQSVSGAARPTRQRPSPKNTAVSRWTLKTPSAPPIS